MAVDKRSASFLFSVTALVLISLLPLAGVFIMHEYQYIAFAVVLFLLTFVFYKLNPFSILVWLSATGAFLAFLVGVFFYKLTGASVNSLYAFSNLIPVMLFVSALFRCLYNVRKRSRNTLPG